MTVTDPTKLESSWPPVSSIETVMPNVWPTLTELGGGVVITT